MNLVLLLLSLVVSSFAPLMMLLRGLLIGMVIIKLLPFLAYLGLGESA